MKIALTIVLLLVVLILKAFTLGESNATIAERATLALGFIMLAGYLLGDILSKYNLPKITGYLFGGIIAGPSIAIILPSLYPMGGIIDSEVTSSLQMVDKLALTLIAFTAGGEMEIHKIKKAFKSIITIVISHILIVSSLVAFLLWLLRGFIPFLNNLEPFHAFLAAFLVGVVATAKSPAETIAIILETKAKGTMTDIVLGVTILKDVIVIIFFSIALNIIVPYLNTSAETGQGIAHIFLEILYSIVAGVIFGFLIILYMRKVERNRTVFVFISSLLIITVSTTYHLEFLLVAIAAGFVVENFSKQGIHFIHSIERASTPVYLIFFTITGANLSLETFMRLWQIVIILFLVRLFSTFLATYFACFVVKQTKEIRNWSWTGFLSQAGISLAFAATIKNSLPGIGESIQGVIIGSIVLNQIFGPILFKLGLSKAKETNT